MDLSQAISGFLFSAFGLVMIFIGFFVKFEGGSFIAILVGIPALLLGIFILINKNENKIEQIKKEMKGGM